MKIGIIGVGAMGSVYAALLADVGKHDVWAIDTWKEHVDAMNTKGLRVEGASGDRTVKINATTNAADVKDCDLVIIATKYDGVTPAAKAALAMAKTDAPILTIRMASDRPTRSPKSSAPSGSWSASSVALARR